MKTTEIRAAAVAEVVEKLGLSDCPQIGANEYIFVTSAIDGQPRNVSVKLSTKNDKDTKTTAAFDLDEAVSAWQEKLAEDAAKAAAPKKSKKSSRRKMVADEDEDED